MQADYRVALVDYKKTIKGCNLFSIFVLRPSSLTPKKTKYLRQDESDSPISKPMVFSRYNTYLVHTYQQVTINGDSMSPDTDTVINSISFNADHSETVNNR